MFHQAYNYYERNTSHAIRMSLFRALQMRQYAPICNSLWFENINYKCHRRNEHVIFIEYWIVSVLHSHSNDRIIIVTCNNSVSMEVAIEKMKRWEICKCPKPIQNKNQINFDWFISNWHTNDFRSTQNAQFNRFDKWTYIIWFDDYLFSLWAIKQLKSQILIEFGVLFIGQS